MEIINFQYNRASSLRNSRARQKKEDSTPSVQPIQRASLYDKGGVKVAASLKFGVDVDHERFKKIVKGKVREDLKKFISPDHFETVRGGKAIKIPKPNIKIPSFRRGSASGGGGVGSGEGEPGDSIGEIDENGEPKPGEGKGEAGKDPGDHNKESSGIEISRSEIAQLIMDDLKLPNLLPKGNANVIEKSIKWTDISQVGSMVDRLATLLQAIQRTSSEKDHVKPSDVVIHPEDVRYITWETDELPQHNAVIFYVMDVSGSMGDEQKQMARTASWYLSTIIGQQFGEINADLRGELATDDSFGDGVEEVFIAHDTKAHEVSEEEFYTTSQGGGTVISSGYAKVEELIKKRYNPADYNIYIYHYSDGDNWGNDNKKTNEIIERLLPQVNSIGYIQTTSSFGSGQFKDFLEENYGRNHNKVRISDIEAHEPDEYKMAVYEMLSEREGANG